MAEAPVNTVTLPVRDAHEAGLERPAAGALDAMRQADAEIAAARAPRPGAFGNASQPAAPAHLGLAGRIIAAVVFHGRAGARLERLLVRHLARRNEIAPPHLGAVELHLARDEIEQPLHGERRLRIAGAAHRRHRRLVAHGDGDVDRQPRHDVGAAHGRGRIVGDVRVLQRIGAGVVQQLAAHAEHLGVGIDRDLQRPILVALVHRVGEIFAAVLGPFDRAAEQLRRRHHGDVLGIDAELGAEAAADVGGDDAQALGRSPSARSASAADRAPSGSRRAP
jgi:hypothetical protein